MTLINSGTKIFWLLALLLLSSPSWAHDPDENDAKENEQQPAQAEDTDSEPHPTDLSDAENAAKVAERAAAAHPPPNAAAQAAAMAAAATDPSAVLTQFQNFFWTTGNSDDNNISNTYLLQPVLPLTKNNVLRPALPVVNTSGKTGIGDLFLLDIFLNPVKSGTWGWGVVGSVPIGNDEFTTDKWQAGPALLYMNKTKPGFLFGILGYNQWSFAGKSSAPDVNVFTYQPIFVNNKDGWYWGWTDQTATYNWKNNYSTIPLGLRFGKVFHAKTPLNAAVGFYYALNNKGRENTFGVKFTATFIKPNMLKH